MPSCRNCGARISKFDSDICPVCGTKEPLKGTNSETIEITSQIDLNNFKEGQNVICRKKTLLTYFLSIGFTGMPFFYLKRKKIGILWIFINLIVLGSLFTLLYFLAHLHIALAIILPIVAIYLLNGIVGAIYYFTTDLKDGVGEFVV